MKNFRVLLRLPDGHVVSELMDFVRGCALERHARRCDPRLITDTAAIRRLWQTAPVRTVRVSMDCMLLPIALEVAPWSLGTTPSGSAEGPHYEQLMKMPTIDAAKFLGWEHYLSGLMTRRSSRERQRTPTR